MWGTIFLAAIGLVAIILIALVLINKFRLDRETSELVQDLLRENESLQKAAFSSGDLKGLPAPVRQYLANAIPEGHEYVRSAHLEWSGEFRLGDEDAPWKQFEADQYFTVGTLGFIWDASIEMAPLLSARVVDMYKDGEGFLRAKIASTVTVAEAEHSAELDAAELMRYLAEAVWFPTALIPGQSVEWTPIDDTSAKATINDLGNRVSLVFFFNDEAEVERVHSAARFREVDGRLIPTPWTGYFRNYERKDGVLVPTDGEVVWNLPDANFAYWRGHLEKIEFEGTP